MERTSKKKLIGQGVFLLFLIVATVIIVRQNRAMPYQHNKGMIFGTTSCTSTTATCKPGYSTSCSR